MDQILKALVVKDIDGNIIPFLTTLDSSSYQELLSAGDMAAAATVSTPPSSLEQPLKTPFARTDALDFLPPPSAQQPHNDENEAPMPFSAQLGLQSMEDFDREHPYRPKPQRPKLVPVPKAKGSSENVVKFQQLCQKVSIVPEFSFEEVALAQFNAKIKVNDDVIAVDDLYPTKKQAKEAACKLALDRLQDLAANVNGKRKRSPSITVKAPVDRSENWIGVLQVWCQGHKVALPVYQEYETESFPTQFGCRVNVDGRTLPFGEELELYSTKKGAKIEAAHKAVRWLRHVGKMDLIPAKRHKTAASIHSPEDGHTGLTQAVQAVGLDRMHTETSLPERFHNLVASLGFLQPRWIAERSKTASGAVGAPYYDMAVQFDPQDVQKEPRLAGIHGRVHQVFGHKKAKDACCEKLIPMMEQLTQDR